MIYKNVPIVFFNIFKENKENFKGFVKQKVRKFHQRMPTSEAKQGD